MKNKNNSILYSAIVIVIVLISVISGKVGGTKDSNDSTTETKTTEVITTEKATTETVTKTEVSTEEDRTETTEVSDERPLTFRNANRLNEHYEKHGIEMGFSSAEEYEAAAKKVVLNKD